MNPFATVLVVEDDPAVRDMLVDLLDLEGYPVATAANGAEALATLRNAPRPSVILLDLMMPGMDGWTFRARQLADPALAAIPVVILSAVAHNDLFAAPGAQLRLLPKPVKSHALLEAIQSYCAA